MRLFSLTTLLVRKYYISANVLIPSFVLVYGMDFAVGGFYDFAKHRGVESCAEFSINFWTGFELDARQITSG